MHRNKYRKVDVDEILAPTHASKSVVMRYGMLYIGDTPPWCRCQLLLAPFFLQSNLSVDDPLMDRVCRRQCARVARNRHRETQLLELCLLMILDLLLQVIYCCELDDHELAMLADAVVETVVPGSKCGGIFHEGVTALDFVHNYMNGVMEKYPPGCVGHMIWNTNKLMKE